MDKDERNLYCKEYQVKNRAKIAARKKAHYEKNKQKTLAINKKWRDENKEKMILSRANSYIKNKEKILKKNKKWRDNNPITDEQKKIDKAKSAVYYKENKEHINTKHKQYRKNNKEKEALRTKKWYEENRGYRAVKSKEYRERNGVKIKHQQNKWRKRNSFKPALYNANRRSAKLKATPKWSETEEIENLYKLAKQHTEDMHVDHIVPLQHKDVCGLHCLANLQIITASENLSKNNSFMG